MPISKRLLLAVGAATVIMESVVSQPAVAADKVSLFKVVTARITDYGLRITVTASP